MLKGKRNANWKGGPVPRICQWCGDLFFAPRKAIRRGHGKFCSAACVRTSNAASAAVRAKARRVAKSCQVCGVTIRVKPSHADTEGTYCSRDCMAKGYAERLTGEENPNYKDGRCDDPRAYANAHSREWRRVHPNKVRHWNRRTKARRKRAEGSHAKRDVDRLMWRQREECACCGESLREGFHVDHIIPIARGGSDYAGNIQLLCPTCNVRKKDFLPVEFRTRRSA